MLAPLFTGALPVFYWLRSLTDWSVLYEIFFEGVFAG